MVGDVWILLMGHLMIWGSINNNDYYYLYSTFLNQIIRLIGSLWGKKIGSEVVYFNKKVTILQYKVVVFRVIILQGKNYDIMRKKSWYLKKKRCHYDFIFKMADLFFRLYIFTTSELGEVHVRIYVTFQNWQSDKHGHLKQRELSATPWMYREWLSKSPHLYDRVSPLSTKAGFSPNSYKHFKLKTWPRTCHTS